MKNGKIYYILGGILCMIAAVFAAVAFSHPELSFPWKNWVSYTIYALYAVYTVLVFCMPKFRSASLAACGILAAQFAALSLFLIFFGTHGTPNENNLYLMVGLLLTCAANFTNLAIQKRKKPNDKRN